MKIKYADITNFKGLRHCHIDFTDYDKPRQITALLGDNGSGKTTVLQAIGLVLSMAARRTPSTDAFQWHGFLADRIGSLGKTRVELSIDFDQTETSTISKLSYEYSQLFPPNHDSDFFPHLPSGAPNIKLVLEDGVLSSPEGPAAINAFAGRYTIEKLSKARPEFRKEYTKLGSIFWFDQMRSLGQSLSSANGAEKPEYAESWQMGVEQLREYLVGWWAHHTTSEKKEGAKDYIPALSEKFNMIFPGVRFKGVSPRGSGSGRISDFFFLLEREGKTFDIAEMSSGEQAVFPLIYEFVRLDIAKSIVLIDELELHLHPPQQQALLAALPKIGPDCQYIITTHSPYLESIIPDEHEVRLEGGRPCL
ncbi:AAA family ATPase [Desulfatibacillum aliphaticivorans]|uniref:AAA family ATPase n=1 Tax=Desulfatibacillum aliphaticivorans TaxID=218208 RepID=UPI000411AB68|nr:ATP-binding protein [Desulfatibacillum aliphaticivorans]